MSHKRTVATVVLTLAALAAPASSLAAANPSGSGQPNQSCEEQSAKPPGFLSGGFANAESHYAGSGSASVLHAGSVHAVSQYDVACYQVSAH